MGPISGLVAIIKFVFFRELFAHDRTITCDFRAPGMEAVPERADTLSATEVAAVSNSGPPRIGPPPRIDFVIFGRRHAIVGNARQISMSLRAIFVSREYNLGAY
jgi:hypothetical protein